MLLPLDLDLFAKEAAPAVMARIARDWMIRDTSLDSIIDEVPDG
jgi:hypothetical protein